MKRRLGGIACGLVLLVTGACGGDDEPSDAEGGAGTTTTAAGAAERVAAVPGIDVIEVDEVDTSEARPLFAWAPVEGAARYSLLVFGEDGSAYWAWDGTDTQVHLGGGRDEPLPEDAEGPTIEHATSWFVVASAPDGTPLAASAEHPL